jgi:hypothetical protein
MTTLILTTITEIIPFSSTLCSGLVLPLIYFTNPLPSIITQELNQLHLDATENNNKYNPQLELITNLSKGITAYDA